MSQNLEDRLKSLRSQTANDKANLARALNEWSSAEQAYNLARENWTEMYTRLSACEHANRPPSPQPPAATAPAAPVSSPGSLNVITPQDLTGTWETHFHNEVVRDKAEITITGNALTITNQTGQTGTGSFGGGRISVTKGWPDTTPNHPLYGTLTRTPDGKIKIEWGQLLEGHGSGGFWVKQ